LTEQQPSFSDSVRRMFSTIAQSYDLLNRLMSFGTDSRWRRKMVKEVPPGEGPVLDLATGTADVALVLAKRDMGRRLIVGADFTLPMLRAGARKITRKGFRKVRLTAGDACCLPFQDGSFNAVTIAFGLRNIPVRSECLQEMTRVLTPGGRVLILEFSRMDRPVLGPLFRFYFHRVMPLIGGLISGNPHAYRYLPESVDSFADPDQVDREMTDSGLVNVIHRPLTFGIAYLHMGEKSGKETASLGKS